MRLNFKVKYCEHIVETKPMFLREIRWTDANNKYTQPVPKKSINVDIPEDSVKFIPHCARTIGMTAKYWIVLQLKAYIVILISYKWKMLNYDTTNFNKSSCAKGL